MLASPAIQSATVTLPSGQTAVTLREESPAPRVGGLRRLGEILPLVMARLEEQADATAESGLAPREVVLAVRLDPYEAPHFYV